jgi:hypothetical protein
MLFVRGREVRTSERRVPRAHRAGACPRCRVRAELCGGVRERERARGACTLAKAQVRPREEAMTRLSSSLLALLPLLAVIAACSTPPSRIAVGAEPHVLWEDAPATPAPAPVPPLLADEAREIAFAHEAAHSCELTARALRKRDRQRGWAVMRQCALRPDFTDLEVLLSPPWFDDLQRADTDGGLVARAIATRGGDVMNDLRLLRKRKVPLFSLQAALEEPDAYRGRLVIMRGTPRGGRFADGARALKLVETKVMAESEWVAVGPRSRSDHDLATRDPAADTARASFAERGVCCWIDGAWTSRWSRCCTT